MRRLLLAVNVVLVVVAAYLAVQLVHAWQAARHAAPTEPSKATVAEAPPPAPPTTARANAPAPGSTISLDNQFCTQSRHDHDPHAAARGDPSRFDRARSARRP